MTDPPRESISFFEQLLQVADLVFPALGISEGVYRVLVIVSLAGAPVALLLSWLFDVTPDGIRLATSSGEAGRVVARLRPLVVYGCLGVGAVALIAIVAIWARPRTAEAGVAPGADVIAVLPFNARGASVEVMGEGMVYLLSRNLDEVGAIRTVDPRTVLHRWNQRLADGLVTAGEAADLTAEVGAGSYLWGHIIEGGGRVQITGDLWTVGGSYLAGVDVTGPVEDVLALVDSFSVAVLREIWRSQRPLPRFDVAAITTGDPEAIRDYLRGERFYRASRWDLAVAAFSRAVEVDSTFALAHYRLARSKLWTGSTDRDEVVRGATENANRYADRLPARERTLVLAAMLQQSGRGTEARDTLVAYLDRYPDDPEVWFAVVDDEYHDRQDADPFRERDVSIEERLRPFDRVLDLDPNFIPGLIHPLEVSIGEGDDARLERYLSMLELAAPEDTLVVATYRTAARALRSPDDLDALSAALVLAMRTEIGSIDMAWQARMAVGGLLTRAVIKLPAATQELLLPGLERRLAVEGGQSRVVHLTLRLLAASGRLDALREAFAAPSIRPPIAAPWQRRYTQLPVELGHVDADFLEGRTPPYDAGALLRAHMISAVDRADTMAIRETAERARQHGRRVDSRTWDRLAAVGEGFARAAAGEPSAGLSDVEEVLEHFDDQFEPLWFRLFEWMTRYPETRARALAILSRPWVEEPAYEVPRLYVLAKALEAEGDVDGARSAYGRFVAILEDADPGLPLHTRIDSARAALARLE
jgi:tetratricopeptide (TPR) repeat protein